MAAEFFPNRPGLDDRAGIVRRRLARGVNDTLFGMFEAIGDAISQAAEEATTRTSQRLLEFAEFLASAESGRYKLEAHETLGRMMHDAVLRSYRGHKRAAALYSPPSPTRMQTGALGKALSDPANIYRATVDGIFFLNETGLSRDALQWARLNYGAGKRGKGSIGPFQVRFSDLVVAEFGLDEPARPGFTIPRGYFWDGESIVAPGARGQHPFYVAGVGPLGKTTKLAQSGRGRGANALNLSIGQKRPTQGIAGWNFLDKGIERLAENFGPVYERMYREVFAASVSRGGRVFSTVMTHPHPRHPYGSRAA